MKGPNERLSISNPFHSKSGPGPLPNESEDEAQERVRALQEAQKRSKEIDEYLLESKKVLEKRKKAAKILLLGQSESGKSSVLKNFQLTFAPKHFEKERFVWKTIVQLNLIGTIKTILEALKDEWEPTEGAPASAQSPTIRNFRRIRLGLSPLFIIEANLMKMLCPESQSFDSREVYVRAGRDWKTLLKRNPMSNVPLTGDGARNPLTSDREESGRRRSQTINNSGSGYDPTSVLVAQKRDIISLWEDPVVRAVLKKRNIRLEDSPGFFLNDIDRIAARDYEPTNLDIIRARLRTVGLEEYHFVVERGEEAGSDVYIIDAGGSKSQRASWVPFFDDVQAVLFLAPLSFNQSLEEDPRVNRLEDSLLLWKSICSNKLLASANLILFFNKKDILTATLEEGVLVKRYVPSYGDQPNDVFHITKYFREKFRSYHKKYSPASRLFICYETSAIDPKSMEVLLIGVQESILRQNLREGRLIYE